ncbi:MAG: hypothetical protein AAGC88_09700 [Bacteroidota bacterium]
MKYLSFLFLLVLSSNLLAQERAQLIDFLGNWQGEGKLFGQAAHYNMTWEETLDGQFIKLTFQNEIISNGQGIKSEAYYQQKGDTAVIGRWFDNRGYIIEIDAELDHDAMTSYWSNEKEKGKTVYTFINVDSITVSDFVWKNEAYAPFSQASYSQSSN